MARQPVVLSTSPSNNASDVKITDSIRITFDTDLDSRYVSDYVYLMDDDGNRIEGRANYRKKVITFTPLQALKKSKSYTFFLVGDVDLEDNKIEGIRSIIGVAMGGRYTVNFRTELGDSIVPPKVSSPVHGTILRNAPLFSWEPVENAVGYEMQIANTNTFNVKLFPIDGEETVISETQIEPNVALEDGIYYWRIRSIRDDGDRGIWSRIYQFHLSAVKEGTISEEDFDDVDPAEEMFEAMELELVESFPTADGIQVPLNVKSMYFRVIGDLDPSLLDVDSISLVGHHISDDYEEYSHGEVSGRITVVESYDGTTYIVFNPDVIPETDGDL